MVMEISSIRVKQYSATYKYVLMVDGNPVCICRGVSSLTDCISYLMNGTPVLKDGKITKILDKVRGEHQ